LDVPIERSIGCTDRAINWSQPFQKTIKTGRSFARYTTTGLGDLTWFANSPS